MAYCELVIVCESDIASELEVVCKSVAFGYLVSVCESDIVCELVAVCKLGAVC